MLGSMLGFIIGVIVGVKIGDSDVLAVGLLEMITLDGSDVGIVGVLLGSNDGDLDGQ